MAPPPAILKQKDVVRARFCRLKPWWQWWMVSPFIAGYAVVAWAVTQDEPLLLAAIGEARAAQFHITERHAQYAMMLLFPALLILQILAALAAYWSSRIRGRALFAPCASVNDATHVQITVKSGMAGSCFAKLERGVRVAGDVVARASGATPGAAAAAGNGGADESIIEFVFLSRRYRWHAGEQRFVKPPLPVKWAVKDYRAMAGVADAAAAAPLAARYGANTFVVPVPPFHEMLLEHATSPFFVFQMFCVALWLLDEYWYSALLTGALLWVFEGTVVRKRLDNLEELRRLQPKPHDVPVLRKGNVWQTTSSAALLPGDIVLFNRPVESVPADIVLLEGSVIVNESMLTGESTPVIKESVEVLEEVEVVDPKHGKLHIVFSGTKVLQATASRAGGKSKYATKFAVPGAAAATGPPSGAVGVVIRTGFETSQGKLMRKIVANSTNRVAAGGPEALAFIGCLLCFAVAASIFVMYHGLQDPKRSRYKLFLHCTMIVTSVVPPELPMELALAVNMTFLLLSKLHIFCTEPFRIPYAGALNTCCFDKTGTLTADVMELMQIVAPIEALNSSTTTNATGNQPGKEGEGKDGAATAASVTNGAVPCSVPEAVLVVAGCHSLVALERGQPPVGDSMEAAAFEGLNLLVSDSNGVATLGGSGGGNRPVFTILNRNPFVPALQRMSCVVQVGLQDRLFGRNHTNAGLVAHGVASRDDVASAAGVYAVAKGSPEAIQALLKDGAYDRALYERMSRKYSRDGCRVIALAFRPIAGDATHAKKLRRADIEAPGSLYWCGFAVFRCPLRSDAAPTIAALRGASQACVMITGDHQYTAAWVAREVGIAPGRHAFLKVREGSTVAWVDEAAVDAEVGDEVPGADGPVGDHDLVVSGEALKAALLDDPSWLAQWAAKVAVWARCNPDQKEAIITSLNAQQRVTLMCGDGSNDVGALTQAHVGVGLLPGCVAAAPARPQKQHGHPLSIPEPLPKDMGFISIIQWRMREKARVKKYMEHLNDMQRLVERARRGEKVVFPPVPPLPAYALEEAEDPDNATFAPITKLGDASMAAPFTARNSSTRATCHLLRLGRCTLVTTLQMYRVMALNCLSSAYGMSVLTQDGVKFSDTQMTVTSSIAAVCFLCMSRGTPAETLSKDNPHTKLFCPYVLLTIAGQFAIHFYHTLEARSLAYGYADLGAVGGGVPDAMSLGGVEYTGTAGGALPNMTEIDDSAAFTPCLLNSFVFLMSTWQLAWVFFINYQGRPFMTPITTNVSLCACLAALLLLVLECSTQLTPIAPFMEIVDFAAYDGVRERFLSILMSDAVGVLVFDAALRGVSAWTKLV